MTGKQKIYLLHDNEQELQSILNNERKELCAFLSDPHPEVEKYTNVKAFIGFSLSHHITLQIED